jgi:hypothetical protein
MSLWYGTKGEHIPLDPPCVPPKKPLAVLVSRWGVHQTCYTSLIFFFFFVTRTRTKHERSNRFFPQTSPARQGNIRWHHRGHQGVYVRPMFRPLGVPQGFAVSQRNQWVSTCAVQHANPTAAALNEINGLAKIVIYCQRSPMIGLQKLSTAFFDCNNS